MLPTFVNETDQPPFSAGTPDHVIFHTISLTMVNAH